MARPLAAWAASGPSGRHAPTTLGRCRLEPTDHHWRRSACGRQSGRRAMLDRGNGGGQPSAPRNVLGDWLEVCSMKPMTGFFRDGCCDTSREDIGSHTVCGVMTAAFLEFSKSRGNDLSTPIPELGFPGLKPGDRWCVCAPRWQEAFEAGQAPRVVCGPLTKAPSSTARSPTSKASQWTLRDRRLAKH